MREKKLSQYPGDELIALGQMTTAEFATIDTAIQLY